MKNSRSGNQFRRLSPRAPAVIFFKWTPSVPTQAFASGYRDLATASNRQLTFRASRT
jgi:hypothetical protein